MQIKILEYSVFRMSSNVAIQFVCNIKVNDKYLFSTK